MKFRIDNAPPQEASPLIDRTAKYLRALPDGDLLTIAAVAKGISRSLDRLQHFSALIPTSLSVKSGIRKLYGNPKTIEAWKKQHVQD